MRDGRTQNPEVRRQKERRILEILEEATDERGEKAERIIESVEVRDKHHARRSYAQRKRKHAGKKIRARIHICRHGENGNNLPCTLEAIE